MRSTLVNMGFYTMAKNSMYMLFRAAGKDPESVPVISLDGAHLKRVYRFEYLEHYVTDNLEDQAQ